MKKHIFLSVTAALFMAGSTALYAGTENPKELKAIEHADVPIHSFWAFGPSKDHLNKKQLEYFHSMGLIKKHDTIKKEIKHVVSKTAKAPEEVSQGLTATIKAMALLEKKDVKAAEAQLQKATTLFDKAMKKDPSLKLVPIDLDINVIDHAITLSDAKNIKKDALKLLKEDHPQETITLLTALKNQITATTTYLPMELYPMATQKALEELKTKKKADIALATLVEGIHTIVTTQIVIPVSVLVAQDAVDAASKLPKAKKNEAKKLLELAQKQLELAQYEGYLSNYSKEYKTLSSEIEKLKEKVGAGNIVEKDYDKLKSYFRTLSDKLHQGRKKTN